MNAVEGKLREKERGGELIIKVDTLSRGISKVHHPPY